MLNKTCFDHICIPTGSSGGFQICAYLQDHFEIHGAQENEISSVIYSTNFKPIKCVFVDKTKS